MRISAQFLHEQIQLQGTILMNSRIESIFDNEFLIKTVVLTTPKKEPIFFSSPTNFIVLKMSINWINPSLLLHNNKMNCLI